MNIKKTNIKKIFEIFESFNPDPKTELEYKNEYTLLIAIILSAQAKDQMVNIATKNLFEICDTAEKMMNYGLKNIELEISSLNFYKTKAKNIFQTSKIIFEKYSNNIPKNFDELILLQGVGRKTANVFLGITTENKEKRIGVDTHVSRVCFRIGMTSSDNDIPKIEDELKKIIPNKFFQNSHHWLVLHGRYICKSKKPLCLECKISKYCKNFLESNNKFN
jgi:endonuclease-3